MMALVVHLYRLESELKMRIHTNDFKNAIKQFGKEIDTKITYTLNNEEITLSSEDLNSVNFHYQGAILKSVMKQLDIDSNVDIPQNTVINAQFGVKVGNQYEYINFGNFVVYKSEKQEDTNSYKITCYDKMLYSMIDYENSNITYPISIRDYINTICFKLGLTFANTNDTFANYDKIIASELYIDTDGNSLGYTFRDVLDELAQVTASTICINDDDELEIRYVTETNDTIDEEYLKDINVNFGELYGPINTVVFARSGGADKIALSNPIDLADNLKNAITIEDNQILNGNDRGDYLQEILDQLYNFQYYVNDFSSIGICYYDLCDRYNVSIGENMYSCVMLNDEINITQGLQENIYADMPEQAETDYTKTTKDDRDSILAKRAMVLADKVNGTVTLVVSAIGDNSGNITPASILLAINDDDSVIKLDANKINLNGYTSINNAFFIDLQGFLHMLGGDILLEDTGENSDPKIEIYDSSAVGESLIQTGMDLSGKTLRFTWASYSETDIIDLNSNITLFTSSGGYTVQGGYYYGALNGESYSLYKNGDYITSLYNAYLENPDSNKMTTYYNKDSYTLPSDFGTITSLNTNCGVYKYIIAPVIVKNKTTTFKSSGIQIYDRLNNINTIYAPNGFRISDSYGSKYFNEHGILFMTNYGAEYSQFAVDEEMLLFATGGGSTKLLFYCTKYSHNQDYMSVQINNVEHLKIDSSGLHYSAISALSLAKLKKNFERFDNGLDIVLNTDVYKYHLKSQTDSEKKHIGFIIGENYKCADQIINNNHDGIDTYSALATAFSAIQNQQKQIESLTKRIQELERKINNE